jgi:PilZ domain-containing protein
MSIERRIKARYPLELAVHYQTLGNQPLRGEGRTVNVSSSGALIAAAEHDFDEGARLKITIEWPTLLDGITPLQLVTTARVVRHRESNFGVAFDWYQFRTMKRSASIALAQPFAETAAAMAGRSSLAKSAAAKTPAAGLPLRNVG